MFLYICCYQGTLKTALFCRRTSISRLYKAIFPWYTLISVDVLPCQVKVIIGTSLKRPMSEWGRVSEYEIGKVDQWRIGGHQSKTRGKVVDQWMKWWKQAWVNSWETYGRNTRQHCRWMKESVWFQLTDSANHPGGKQTKRINAAELASLTTLKRSKNKQGKTRKNGLNP